MKYLLNLFALLLFMAMSSCGGNSSDFTIQHTNSCVSGEQSELAAIVTSKSSTVSVEEKHGQWNFKVYVTLSNVKRLSFGNCQGSTFELRLLTEDGTQLDYDFTPGATDKGAQKASEKLLDMMSSAPGTQKEFAFHYTTDDKDEADKLKKDLKSVTGVEIINFDFAGQFFESDEDQEADQSLEATDNEMSNQGVDAQDIVVTFSIEKTYYGNTNGPIKYKNNYKITLHENGDADIHTEIHYPMSGQIGEPSKDDYTGSWAERSIMRGANFVPYYDIEWSNSEKTLNWCIDKDFRFIYLTWHSFEINNSESRFAVTRIQ